MSRRTIGITGPDGFIAGHLTRRLQRDENTSLLPIPRNSLQHPSTLANIVRQCDTIVHLAGRSRGNDEEIYRSNLDLVSRLTEAAQSCRHAPHVVFASSTQRDRDNAYGRSKRDAEQHLTVWAKRDGASLTTLVIPNVYGPGCRPFYNSVVATYCHQLAHGQTPVVMEDREVEFVWINNLVDDIFRAILDRPAGVEVHRVASTAQLTVAALLAKLSAFRTAYFDDNVVPDLSDSLDASLYVTFLSHVELTDHCHRPEVRKDDRGQLFEIIRLANGGQVFFSTTKPGVIRGNHFHTRKVEWFCVVRGDAAIRLRRVADDRVCEFHVTGETPQVVSIPPLHTHQIENVGDEDLLTMFWCNELFEPADPDTFYEQVA